MTQIRPFVLLIPMGLFLIAVVASLVDRDSFLAFAKMLNDWILAHFSTAISWAVFSFVLTCIVIVLSPLGRVVIGGMGAKRLLDPWSWFSITLCTTIAIGILFWAMAEPIFHYYAPGGEARGIAPASTEAEMFSLVSLFMHWAFSPYAIYTVAGLTFALSYHNLHVPYTVSGPFTFLFGRKPPAGVTGVLDASILLALILGMAASLGAGMLLLAGGLDKLFGFGKGSLSLGLIALGIGVVVLISSLTGLLRGIRTLSLINTWFFILFVGFIILNGPSLKMLATGGEAALSYITGFVERSLFLGDASADQAWARDWTVFYFANWLAWAPLTAMFLGRIARGYTVRSFVLVNLVLPALFSIVWMSVFGVFAIEVEAQTGGALQASLEAEGPESVMFRALDELPLTIVLVPLLLALSFISYVTAADSNTEAISQICRPHQADEDPEATGPSAPRLKILWVLILCFMAWVMVSVSRIDGVRMLSNVGGLPALFIVIGLQFTLIRMAIQADRIALAEPLLSAQPARNPAKQASLS